MAPLYKKALIIGATSGIGLALAEKVITAGTFVIHGDSKAFIFALDVRELDRIPAFAKSIAQAHPDLDAIVLSAGIQRGLNFTKPEAIDLNTFSDELLTNYTAIVHLVTAFLPHLQALGKEKETHLVFISTALALVPSMICTPGYNASKAALHTFIMNLREQLRGNGDRVRCVEVFPPAVQTELHDTNHQPDLKNGDHIGMPLDQYTEALYKGLKGGGEQVATGHAEAWVEEGGFEAEKQKIYYASYPQVQKMLAQFINN
ncbi:NAD(P)-binding protein [Xylariaceae sp. AK1471]|nr:NAD(P)-binding protein [Xylariaceae sp. AK1471]